MAGSSTNYRDLLKTFEGPSVENDTHFERASPGDQQLMNRFVHVANRAYARAIKNGVPESYRENAKLMREILRKTKKENEGAPINIEATYALTAAVGQTIYAVDVTARMPIPTEVVEYNGGPRWAIRDYEVESVGWPAFTKEFRNPRYIDIKNNKGWTNCIGLIQGWNIPWTVIQESKGGLWSPEAIMMAECGKKMGVQRKRTRLLGTSIKNSRADDGSEAGSFGVTGLYNHASLVTAFEAGLGADDDVTAAGDIYPSFIKALTDLKTAYDAGPIISISTSGICSEPFHHRDTYTGQLDAHSLRELVGPGRAISAWYCTDDLYSGTPGVASQRWLVLKAAPSVVKFVEVYPMQTLPIAKKLYDGDIAQVMIWGGGVQYIQRNTTDNGYGATAEDVSDTTTTGFIPEGTDVAAMINAFPNAYGSPNF